uniref:NADH dehydrogenase subunit 6 n=1 Tax=Trybliographa sp. ZJUH 20220008 TaxID=2943454 RepID=A0A9E8G7B8_9HYME|nr:NADH dehydrogenase subunit 6 [Trybliographa sp. ZJUH 20220008]
MFYLHYILLIIFIMLLLIPGNFKGVHPLMMGSVMLSVSIVVSLNMNIFNKSSIYSMIMYLIVIGGFLILFLYFNSFAINNKVMFSMGVNVLYLYKCFMLMMLFFLVFIKINNFNMLIFINNKILETLNLLGMINLKNNKDLNLVYFKFSVLVMFGMFYLLYVLILVVKILFFYNPKSIRQML